MNTFSNTSQTQGVAAKPVPIIPLKEPEQQSQDRHLQQQPLAQQQHSAGVMPQQQHLPLQQQGYQQQQSLQQPHHGSLNQFQQPLNQQQLSGQQLPGASAQLPADVSNAHVATSGVAWDVPVDQNKHGVVSAQPIDNVHRVADITPSQFHQHDQQQHNLAGAGAGFQQPLQQRSGDILHQRSGDLLHQQRAGDIPSAPAAVPLSGGMMNQQPGLDSHGHVGNRLFAFMETQGGDHDGNFRWKDFKGYLEKSGWEQKKAEDSWYMFDTKKNGWLSRSDFLRFANEPSNRSYIQKIESDLPGGTGLAVGGIAGMTQQLKHTGLDARGDIHDNSTALEHAGAVYTSSLAAPAPADSEAKPKTATAFGDRISQFFNKGHIGNRLFTFLDEEDDKRGGVVTWGQLSLLLTQYGGWDVNQAQSAWWKIDDKHTSSMTRSEFVKFCELDESREHIQLIEAELTGKTGTGRFGKKIKQEDLNVENSGTFTGPSAATASSAAAPGTFQQQAGTFQQQQPGTLHRSAALQGTPATGLQATPASYVQPPGSSTVSQDPMRMGQQNLNTGLQQGAPNTGILHTDSSLQQQQSPFVPGKELPRD